MNPYTPTQTPTPPRGHIGLAAVAALVPTVLSAQGMVSVAMDALGFAWWLAGALAVFLELALIWSAVHARSLLRRGGDAAADLAFTWLVSALSGLLSATHELIGPDGTWGPVTATAMLAAVVRFVAPLVACWVWHRTLIGEADGLHTAPTRPRQRRTLDMLRLAIATHTARTDASPRAQSRLMDAHVRVLRRYWDVDPGESAHDEARRMITAVAQVSELPRMATVEPLHAPVSDATPIPAPEGPAAPEGAQAGAEAATAEQVALWEAASSPRTPTPDAGDIVAAITAGIPTSREDVAHELLAREPEATSADLSDALTAAGHEVPSPSTLRRTLRQVREDRDRHRLSVVH